MASVTHDERIVWLDDVSPADWIAPRLHGFAEDTGSVIPEGYEAYCRIFHPWDAKTDRPRSWAQMAEANGRIVHPEMQAHTISRPAGTPGEAFDLNDYINRLEWGRLPHPERSALVSILKSKSADSATCWFCVWEGVGSLDFAGVTDRVRLPHRNYVLYSGPIELALATLDVFGTAPNLWWPKDRSWIVVTEIDYAWTYVGGTAELISAICESVQLEALPAKLTDKPFVDSDTINAALDATTNE